MSGTLTISALLKTRAHGSAQLAKTGMRCVECIVEEALLMSVISQESRDEEDGHLTLAS